LGAGQLPGVEFFATGDRWRGLGARRDAGELRGASSHCRARHSTPPTVLAGHGALAIARFAAAL